MNELPSEPRPAGRRERLAALLLLVLLPTCLRLASIDHGLPENHVPDTHVVRSALGMAQSKDLVPPAGRYSNYPNLMPYALLPLYGGWFGVGLARGRWSGVEEFGDHLKAHPEGAHEIARWLVALLGGLTAWATWRAARAAGLRAGAFGAGLLVAFGLLHVQLSTHERPWVPMTFFIVLAAWASVLHVRTGERAPLVWCGLWSGLAWAAHQGGAAALGIAGLAWVLAPGGWRGAALGRRVAGGFAAVAAALAAGLALGHPYLVVHGFTPENEIGGGAADVQLGGLSMMLDLRWETFERLSVVLAGYDPLVLVLGLAGLVPALARRALRPVVLWTLGWGAFFMTNYNDHGRYLLPVVVLLALPAGVAIEAAWRWPAGRALVVVALAFAALQAGRLVQLLGREDARVRGAELVAEVVQRDRARGAALVAIDRYGPDVELDKDSLERLAVLRARRGDGLTLRERHRLERLSSRLDEGGAAALPLGELLEFDPRAGTVAVRAELESLGATPAELLRALGVSHLLLVERRWGGGERHPLRAELELGQPVARVDPSGGRAAGEAFLPTEMDFPLTGLWSVDRPGPRMELFELSGAR